MKLKHIAHLTFNMGIGGAEQVIYNLVENTDSSKYKVSILCLECPIGDFGIQLQKKAYPITALNRRPGFDFSMIKNIREFIYTYQIDVLHCHQYTPYVYGVLSAVFTPCRVIFTEHGRFYPDQRKIKRVLINPFLNLMTDNVTAISSATRDALVQFENFPKNKIKLVYNGIDDSRFQQVTHSNKKESLGIPEHARVLGTVARLDTIKNQKMMIKALKRVHQVFPETFLIIVGDGPERKNLEQMTSKSDLSSQVIFTGFREDTPLFYKIMDIFLLTSFSEGTAMTLLEAMSMGLPCIATNVGGNPEIVMHEKTGYIVPSDDENELAEKIITLFKNPAKMSDMGDRGRRRFEADFTVEKMVESYQGMYEGNVK